MPIKEARHIWHNGQFIPWKEATIHVMTHALHYGSSVFEGIRSYDAHCGTVIFRLRDHIRRFFDSARIYRMNMPYDFSQVMDVCHQVLTINDLSNAYIRPIAFVGYGEIGLFPAIRKVDMSIAAFEWGAYLGQEALEKGVDVGVTSWNRNAPNTTPPMAKAGGNYLSSQLICAEAKRHGYDEGLALDVNGFISEGPGENFFLVRDNVIYTPSLSSSILAGITRDSVIKIAQQLGYEVRETNLPREYLYLADELFFTGTAAEVVPIRSVDGLQVGKGVAGQVTRAIQSYFYGLFTGQAQDHWGWLEQVPAMAAAV